MFNLNIVIIERPFSCFALFCFVIVVVVAVFFFGGEVEREGLDGTTEKK